jgi:CPA1 family monovalent cation:H+ antiporter
LAFIPGVPQVALTHQVILTVFLPVLLFHGAYNLPLAELRATIRLVSFLALPGVLATAGLVGVALHALAGMPWAGALLLGTIVSATDPVSVLAIFGQLGAPRRLTAIVSGESLFNDGTALVLFAIALDAAQGGQATVPGVLGRLALVLGGSLGLGALVGLLGAQLLRRVDDALVETSITLIMAYGGYLVADHLALSGPLETVAAGILLGTRGEAVMGAGTRLQARATWEFLDFLANSLLFLLMGLAARSVALAPGEHLGDRLVGPVLVALAAVVGARVLVLWGIGRALALFGQPLPAGWGPVLVWAGLRGAVSLAAALSLPAGLADRDLLLVLTFGVVLFTLLTQGLTIAPLLRRFGLVEPQSASEGLHRTDQAPSPPVGAEGGLPGTLGPVLDLAARDQGLDEAELARWLGIGPEQLAALRRLPTPDPTDPQYAAAVEALVGQVACNSRVLRSIMRGWWALGLIWPLLAFQRRYGLSDADLAAYLEIPPARLDRLGRQLPPWSGEESYQDAVGRIAKEVGCNPGRLAAVLAEGGPEADGRHGGPYDHPAR